MDPVLRQHRAVAVGVLVDPVVARDACLDLAVEGAVSLRQFGPWGAQQPVERETGGVVEAGEDRSTVRCDIQGKKAGQSGEFTLRESAAEKHRFI